jgi:Cys-rich repeat protein
MDCDGPNATCVAGACELGCSQGGNCPFGLQCLTATNLCVRCLADDDCPNRNICEDNDCVPGCRVDDDCGNGRLCVSNACVTGCTVMPNSCPPAQVCDPSLGPAGQCRPGCNSAADCGDQNQFTCVQNQCVGNCQNDDECNRSSICEMGACVPGCRPPEKTCGDGFYCTSTASNQAGQCLRGCDTDDDCGGVENICNVPTHTCVECLSNMDCTLGGNVMATCDTATSTCQITCQSGQFDLCRALGFFCDETSMTCVGCTSTDDCDAFESCTANRCVPNNNLPLCAPCDTDEQCGGAADLCVTRQFNGRSERVCGTDCASGQACPSGTACLQVGGGTTPVRGRQCLPVNSVGSTSCAARLDMEAQVECNRGQDCGLSGGTNTPDAICSGAGSSEGLCTVFCTVGGNDCPPGFTCEDPPDSPNQMFRPRCGPN